MPKATLINSAGQKVVVDSGSQQAQQYFGKGYKLFTPPVPTSLTQSQIQNTSTIGTNPMPTQYDPNSFVNGSKAYFDQVMKDYQSSQEQAAKLQEQQFNQRGTISKLMETIGGKGTDYQSQLDQLGVNENTTKLQDLNAQIASANAAFNKQVVGLEGQGRGITTGILGNQESLIRRQQAAEVGALTSMAQAVQGNIELAYQTADKAIQMKYEPLENELKQQLQQLDFIYQDLSSAEKKKADAQATLLNERLRLIDEQKTNENQITQIALEAAKNGADVNTLNKIRNSKTVGEAIANSGTSLSNVAGKYSVQQIGTDANGNPVYGSFNQQTGNITPLGATNLSSGIVGGYDIASYATDPQHEQKVANILSDIGKFNTIQDVDNYIKTRYPKSPITGQMIANASQKYGVSWEMMVAIMAQDSSMGTAGKGARTFNPGNVGNNDSGQIVNFGNWQAGVDAVARNLAGRKLDTAQTTTSPADNWAKLIISGKAKINQVPKALQSDVASIVASEQDNKKNTDLQNEAATSAQALLDKFNTGQGTSAVGKSRMLGLQLVPGSKAKDFEIQFNNLKSLLSLENVKYLKGQGQVSDAERKLLADASAKLDLAQSESEFKTSLENIVKVLNKVQGNTNLEEQVKSKGYDYQRMKADGYSDEEIKQTLNIQ